MLQHPLKGLLTSIRGPKTVGPMIAEPVPKWITEEQEKKNKLSGIPVTVVR
jgi:hypothetical protein